MFFRPMHHHSWSAISGHGGTWRHTLPYLQVHVAERAKAPGARSDLGSVGLQRHKRGLAEQHGPDLVIASGECSLALGGADVLDLEPALWRHADKTCALRATTQ